jgi:vacuolar-type H+-ATPase subunit F/Vma7
VSRLIAITTEELAPGFRLAGADVRAVTSKEEAAEALRKLLGAGEHGLIALHGPWYDALDRDLRRRIESHPVPLVGPLAAGTDPDAGLQRTERLRRLLWEAVGYEITFDEGG